MTNVSEMAIEYLTVMNGEEQYSIWPATKAVPEGWTAVGAPSPKQACLDYIERTWTDLRPLSLRQKMDG